MKTFDPSPDQEETFYGQFHYYMDNYYHRFLALNFKTYRMDLFLRNKDKEGNYFDYSIDEVTEKMWK